LFGRPACGLLGAQHFFLETVVGLTGSPSAVRRSTTRLSLAGPCLVSSTIVTSLALKDTHVVPGGGFVGSGDLRPLRPSLRANRLLDRSHNTAFVCGRRGSQDRGVTHLTRGWLAPTWCLLGPPLPSGCTRDSSPQGFLKVPAQGFFSRSRDRLDDPFVNANKPQKSSLASDGSAFAAKGRSQLLQALLHGTRISTTPPRASVLTRQSPPSASARSPLRSASDTTYSRHYSAGIAAISRPIRPSANVTACCLLC
jgi:hypothetical protein